MAPRALHVTLRVERALGSLRKRTCYGAIQAAALTVLPHEDCRIVVLSIQRTHLHLIVEAESSAALSAGMQAFQISAAKQLNAAVSRAGSWWQRRRAVRGATARGATGRGTTARGAAVRGATVRGEAAVRAALPKRRKGRVFADRYHARMITKPLQARRELAYVLNNWRKHGEDRVGVARTWQIDPFATGWCFDGWRERADTPFAWRLRETYVPIPVYVPRTWLLREGWRRHGLIGTHEVPGSGRLLQAAAAGGLSAPRCRAAERAAVPGR